MLLQILKIIAGVATIVTGIVSLFWPLKVPGFTGLEPNGGRGITEIRTILGALFVGLGAAVLFYNSSEGYAILGITYLAMALVRGISILVDKSPVSSNIISFIVELVFGFILIL
ncbi:MAG: DUF4345 family protein [Anaerolineales bacterium]|nr:DUF4345 family protein [Anaerolineales bacterium]TFG50101.1 MAG: DUF4345 domain-containing protein [Anaerolineales bacterium]